jgi:hypothetical protein
MEFQTKDGLVTREKLKNMIGIGPFLAGYWKTAEAAALHARTHYRSTNPGQWLALQDLCEELRREALGKPTPRPR